MRPWSITRIRLTGGIPTLPPPPFLQTCSEVEEERDEFSPIRRNKPPKGSPSHILQIELCEGVERFPWQADRI